MAGITDLPFRTVVSGFGAGLVVSELVASGEMLLAKPEARARAELGMDAGNTAIQIAGRDPVIMAECARMLEANGARMIDINMGCPAKKVTGGQCGSALMRSPDLARRLVDAVAGAVSLPVSVKMRLGWDDDALNAPQIARDAVDAGASMITVHGRTRCQFYKGRADWRAVWGVVHAVDVPVIVNGDIVDAASARQALDQSGAAGVMVGRGAQGRPWVLNQIAAALSGRVAPATPGARDIARLAGNHYDAALRFYGPDLGRRTVRKHLGWYLDQLDIDPATRRALLTSDEPSWVLGTLRDLGTATRAQAA